MTGQVLWAFQIFQIHVLGPTSWAFSWAAVDGRGHGPEPIVLLGGRMGYLGIGAATGKALFDPLSSLVFVEKHFIGARKAILQRSYPSPNDPASSSSAHQQSWSNPTTSTRSSPVPIEKGIITNQDVIFEMNY